MGKSRVTINTFAGTVTTKPVDDAQAQQIAAQARDIQTRGRNDVPQPISSVTVTPAE
jgi:hypothetical protein